MASAARETASNWLRESKTETQGHGPAFDRLPQFRALLERFPDVAGEALSTIFGAAASGTIEQVDNVGVFDLLNAQLGAPAAVLRCAALDARAALVFDPEIVPILINSIFGVDPTVEAGLALDEASGPPADDGEPRQRTELETRLVGEFAKALTRALLDAFAPTLTFDLTFESLNTIEDTNLLGQRDMSAISAQYTLKMAGGAFRLIALLPETLTTPLSEMFVEAPVANTAKADPAWSRRMERGVTQAPIKLTAILDEFELTLGEIASLCTGAVLPLSAAGESYVRIECVERGVFLCHLGEKGDRYALEIADIIATNPEDPEYVAP